MSALADLVARDLMAPDWAEALAPVDEQVAAVQAFLADEVEAGRPWLPDPDAVFRAFRAPLADVRVLVVGQDPYPTPGHPIGLSFAVRRDVRPLPPSLRNIYRELHDDLGIDPPAHGDLTPWADQGVMLLNRVLTVGAGDSDSHRGVGWEAVTDHAVRALVERPTTHGPPLVAVLWGSKAQTLRPLLATALVVESSHPSPLSARVSFFGSRPFSRVNAMLAERGAEPIDWDLGE